MVFSKLFVVLVPPKFNSVKTCSLKRIVSFGLFIKRKIIQQYGVIADIVNKKYLFTLYYISIN